MTNKLTVLSRISEFRKKKCLVTGGAGFIGSHLVSALVRAEASVTVVDSLAPQFGGNLRNLADVMSQIEFHAEDITERSVVNELISGFDFVFNLAGQSSHLDSMNDPWADLEINSLAQLHLLESVRRNNPSARIVYASTRQIYGRPRYLPVDENHPIEPVDVNGVNKSAGERFHILYSQVHGLAATVLRLTNTYGPGMRVKDARQTFLGTWVRTAIEGKCFQIYGDGSQLRDFNYVEDVVDALLRAAVSQDAVGRAINLGANEVINLLDLAKLLRSIQPSSDFEVIEFPPERKAIDIGDYYSDWRLAQKVLGWKPQIGLRDGLQQTVRYFDQNGEFYW